MEDTTNNAGTGKILALSPSRRAIGAAVVDHIGPVWSQLCRLADLREEAFVAKARTWLADILVRQKPKVVVIEKLRPKQATRTNLMLSGLLEATAAAHHVETVVRADLKEALLALQTKSNRGLWAETVRQVTLRYAAALLGDECPELRIHTPPEKPAILARDWERSWGRMVKALVLGLHVRDKSHSHFEHVYAPPAPSPSSAASAPSPWGGTQ